MKEKHILYNFVERYQLPSNILKGRMLDFERFNCPRCHTKLFEGEIGHSVPQGKEFNCHNCKLIMLAQGNGLTISTPFFDRWKDENIS